MKRLLFCCASVFVASTLHATIWHVSPTVLPAIPTKDQFRTIQTAARKVNPGDVVLIHSGVYRETVIIEKNGTATNPIRFEAAPGENVVVTGLDRLTRWRK